MQKGIECHDFVETETYIHHLYLGGQWVIDVGNTQNEANKKMQFQSRVFPSMIMNKIVGTQYDPISSFVAKASLYLGILLGY